jgi:hypothetical protein
MKKKHMVKRRKEAKVSYVANKIPLIRIRGPINV